MSGLEKGTGTADDLQIGLLNNLRGAGVWWAMDKPNSEKHLNPFVS
jgi:hypothetical protein